VGIIPSIYRLQKPGGMKRYETQGCIDGLAEKLTSPAPRLVLLYVQPVPWEWS